MPELPSGHVDKIDIKVVRNGATQVNEIERDKTNWMQTLVPADLYNKVKDKFEGTQFRVEHQINLYYFWMNTTKPPFDDVKVRQAVNYAVDPRRAGTDLRRLARRRPPDPARRACPATRRSTSTRTNMAKAKALLKEANPSDRDITVWTDNESPNDEAGAYYQDVLSKLGFNAKLKTINADSYFSR